MTLDFKIGDKVEKVGSYAFRGVVDSVFQKQNGTWMLAVEIASEDYLGCRCENCLDPNGAGMIHIFRPEQFKKRV